MGEAKVNVPARSHVPVISVILISLGTTFGAFGIAQVMGFFSSITSGVTTYLTQSLSWNPQWSSVVIGIVFLVMSAVAFKSSSKFKEWSNHVKSVMVPNVDMTPENFYALEVVPSKYLINHMVKYRGCKKIPNKSGKGVTITCPSVSEESLKKISEHESLANGTRLAIILFLNIVVILPLIMIRNGSMDLQYGPWVWYVFLVIMLAIFYEAMILPMWALVIMYILHTLIAMIVAPEILSIVSIAVPGAIIFFGISLVLYMFKTEQCKKETNWWCDRL